MSEPSIADLGNGHEAPKSNGHSDPGELKRSGFSTAQVGALISRPEPHRIHISDRDGRKLHYIEGWFAIAQANAIFGFAGWDRELVHFERVFERTRTDGVACGYIARVRLKVRAGRQLVTREGTGWGYAVAITGADAHERALKTAETDATKRALATFGNAFGLCLYDKDQAPSRNCWQIFAPDGQQLAGSLSPEAFCSGLRQLIETCRTADELDKLVLYNGTSIAQLRERAPALRTRNGDHFADVLTYLSEQARKKLQRGSQSATNNGVPSAIVPPVDDANASEPTNVATDREASSANRTSPTGVSPSVPLNVASEHSSDVRQEQADTDVGLREPPASILSLSGSAPTPSPSDELRGNTRPRRKVRPDHASEAHPLPPSKITNGQRVDKSALTLGVERRLRDKQHLKRVAELPCTVCGRQPSHAHHLKFAQRRGLSQKVSDEYVVPLCALHHGDLHRGDSETAWWNKQNIEPLPIAAKLWRERNRQ